MARSVRLEQKAIAECEAFNAANPVGTVVEYYFRDNPVVKPSIHRTRSEAFVTHDGVTPAIFLEAKAAYVALSHCRPRSEPTAAISL